MANLDLLLLVNSVRTVILLQYYKASLFRQRDKSVVFYKSNMCLRMAMLFYIDIEKGKKNPTDMYYQYVNISRLRRHLETLELF